LYSTGIILAFFLLIPVSLFAAPIKDPSPVLRSGDLFPSVSLPNWLNAEERNYLGIGEKRAFLPGEIKAELTVFKFLNTNCGYCIKLLPVFNDIYHMIERDPVLRAKIKILGIGAGDTAAELEKFKKTYPAPYPVIPDPEFRAHKAVGEPRVPFIVVARKDKQGKWVVATVNVGLVFSVESFVGELKAILNIDPETLQLKKPVQ